MMLNLEPLLKVASWIILNYYVLLIGVTCVVIGIIAYVLRLRKKKNAISIISSIPVTQSQQNNPTNNYNNIVNSPQIMNRQINYRPNYNMMPPPRYMMMRRYRWINRMRKFWRRTFRRGRRGRRWRDQYY